MDPETLENGGAYEPAAEELASPAVDESPESGFELDDVVAPEPQWAPPVAQAEDPRFALIEELQYSDPRKAEALRMQIAEDRALARMRQEFAPLIGPTVQRQALSSLGLEGEGARYVASLLAMESPQAVQFLTSNPVTRELLTRAGRDYGREKSTGGLRFESAYSETGTLTSEDRAAAAAFERQFGVKADKKLIAMAKRDKAQRMA